MILLIPFMSKPDLKEVLSHYLRCNNLIQAIWVVDLQIDEENKSFATHHRINYVTLDELFFNKSFAINIGIHQILRCNTSIEADILICDADVKIPFEVLTQIQDCSTENVILHEVIESEDQRSRIAYGVIKTKLSSLLKVKGYDSKFIGWGFEDHDIIFRIEAVSTAFIRLGHGYHLSHSDYYRVKNYYADNLQEMRISNLKYYELKKRRNLLMGTYDRDIMTYKKKYSEL